MRAGVRVLFRLAPCAVMAACSSSSSSAPASGSGTRSPDAACEAAGDAEACAAAAELYFEGTNGHPLDHARSFRYASAACEKGHAYGCALAGYHHQDGLGTEWSPDRAVAAYEKACAGGSGVGCYNLATMYSGGHGVTADHARADGYKAKARAAWEAACRGSEPRWCTNLAFLLREEDAKGNRARCLELDQRACDHHVAIGCTEAVRDRSDLGQLSEAAMRRELERLCGDGEPSACTLVGTTVIAGGPADARRGLELVVRGCEIGDKQGCWLAGAMYADGKLVTADPTRADRFVRLACDRGMGAACLMVAQDRGRRGQLAEAAAFARRACQMGQAEGCAALSQLSFSGQGVAASESEGLRWATEACRMGYPPACAPLIEKGKELPVPPDMAARVYRDACAGGIQSACAHEGEARSPK
jgi:uncharacterized protein